jgi:Ca-activated chloride channel family protein
MKRKNLTILTLVFCLVSIPAIVGFLKIEAQTNPVTRAQKTPPPSPTIVEEDDDGPIRIDTDVVNLNVRVIDRNNRPVNNLRKEDFKVYEDNVLQEIESFSKSEVPTNYALVVDNSGSMRSQLEKVIEASKIIINTNRPDDESMIVRFISRDKITIEQPFTSNKADLLETLDNLYIEGGQTAIIDAVYLTTEQVDQYEKSRDPNDKKRRALILITDGEDRDSYYNEQQLFDLLRESDVQIYIIGFINELSKEGGFISKSPQAKAKSFLERMARETGGKAYFPNSLSELNGIATDIAQELRTQYLISYSPTNTAKDGSIRTIKVVVADGPNKEKRIALTRTSRRAVSSNPK